MPTMGRWRASCARPRHELARRGELQRRAREMHAERPKVVERERQLAESGSELGSRRAAAFLARRAERARALGFVSLAAFYWQRYRLEQVRLDELAAELGCGESAVRGDLRRLGLGPDRARSHGARWHSP